ncbi:MAG: lectin-like protein, partial [Phycisphaerales bacterium]
MKILIQAAVVTLSAASAAQAHQAVQWKVSDGGNGHWYALRARAGRTWTQVEAACRAEGAYLATMTSPAERNFMVPVMAGNSCAIGGFQSVSSPSDEPGIGWRWVTDEAMTWTNWASWEPSNVDTYGAPFENVMGCFADGVWVDLADHLIWTQHYLVEWSADCNGDGIVDYRQCRDGSLPDYDGNNVPDCCESGTPCVVGNYPVQWRTQDGGNGHWYKVDRFGGQLSWASASLRAQDAGGHLACLSSAHENSFVFSLIASDPSAWNDKNGPWIGARREGGTWSWVNGEAWSFTNWCGGTGTVEHRGQYWACSGTAPSDEWNDHFGDVGPVSGPLMPVAAIIEWSADCNNDGIVDKGQILGGQLQDANNDGVPDVCQQPTCRDADFFPDRNINGVDLGVLLSQWGARPQRRPSRVQGRTARCTGPRCCSP